MKRGDVVVMVAQGDFGKPRPAVIVQTDMLNPTHSTILVCPISSNSYEAQLYRIKIAPTKMNGLKKPSHIMADKATALLKQRIKKRIGCLTEDELMELEKSLGFVLGLAG